MANFSEAEFSEAVQAVLAGYRDDVIKGMDEAAKKAIDLCRDEIKSHVTFQQPTGAYVASMTVKKTKTSSEGCEYTWYAKEYRLTHLLENGHAKVNGGRTRAFPHIRYGEQVANTFFEEQLRQILEASSSS